jgi:hypothetical protein
MSDSPLLGKMDALLKKHRGGSEADSAAPSDPATVPKSGPASERTPPPGAWLPVLTDVIERGTPPAMAAPARVTVSTSPAEPALPTATPATPPSPSVEPDAPAIDAPSSVVTDTLAEQLMGELAPRLSEVMEKQVAAELRRNLDQTVATLLSQLDVNVREIVREAVAEKLKQPRDPST